MSGTVVINKEYLRQREGTHDKLTGVFKRNGKSLHIAINEDVERIDININKGNFHRLKKIYIECHNPNIAHEVVFTGDLCYKSISLQNITLVNNMLTQTVFSRVKELHIDRVTIKGKPLKITNAFMNRVNLNTLVIEGPLTNVEVNADLKQIVEHTRAELSIKDVMLRGDSNVNNINLWPAHISFGHINELHGVISNGTGLRHLTVYDSPGFKGIDPNGNIALSELDITRCPLATSTVLRLIKSIFDARSRYNNLKITTDVDVVPEQQRKALSDIVTIRKH